MPLSLPAENFSLFEISSVTTHIGLHTAYPGLGVDPGPGEPPTDSGYGRQAVTWAPIKNAQLSNSIPVTFSVPACAVLYATFWNRPSVPTYYGYTYYDGPPPPDIYLGFTPVMADTPHPFDLATVTTDGTVTSPRHTLTGGALVRLGQKPLGYELPNGFVSGPLYSLTDIDVDSFRLYVNEVQTVTITGAPTGGTFTLSAGGPPTTALARDTPAATVRGALEVLPGIGADNVTVTGGYGSGLPWTVTFVGDLAGSGVATLTAVSSLTGGTTPGVTVNTLIGGSGVITPVNTGVVFWQEVVPLVYASAASVTLGSAAIVLSSRGF